MLRFVILVYWLTLAYGSAIRPDRGILQSPVIGGDEIEISDAPWQVALEYDYNGIGYYALRCGGTIIGRTFILTAAHCTYGSTESEWRVRAGTSQHASGGKTFIVIKIVNHEHYSIANFDYDISIIKLYDAIQVDDVFTQIANLPLQNQVVELQSLAAVTGWGSIFAGGEISPNLRRVMLPVVDQGACAELYSGYNTITDRMICGGVLGEGGKDACQGDSGGPFVVLGQLIGITSWGRSCGLGDAPGVWTRVPVFVDWINEQKLIM